jgi:integrase
VLGWVFGAFMRVGGSAADSFDMPVNMVQRVMGHERSSTTLDLYTRRTDDHSRILQALDGDDDLC